jgi:uncharacterized protein YjbI with pentapeptide repeats
MANQEHLKIIWQGVDVWNSWRHRNPHEIPDLAGAELTLEFGRYGPDDIGVELPGINLRGAYLQEAHLVMAQLPGANFEDAAMYGIVLSQANLTQANLRGVELSYANLRNAILEGG